MKRNKLLIGIIFLVLAIAIVAVYFLFFNSVSESCIDSDQIVLKSVLREGGLLERKIVLRNHCESSRFADVKMLDLEDVAEIGDTSFEILPGQTRDLAINFSAPGNYSGGVYVGGVQISCENDVKSIPIILEVETEDVLFDGNLDLFPTSKISSGDKINAEIKIFDLSQIGTANIDMEYFVKDSSGNTIVSEADSPVVGGTQVLITKSVDLPEDLEEGDYVFGVTLKYKNSVGTTSAFFRVGNGGLNFLPSAEDNMLYFFVLLAFIILILLLFMFYTIYSRDKLLDELKCQYKGELRRQNNYLSKRQRETEKKLETHKERKISKKLFAQARRKMRREVEKEHRQRQKELRKLKKDKKKDEMKKQVQKWKKKGYNTSVLEKNLPTEKSIKEQIKEFKKKGYNTSVLEKR